MAISWVSCDHVKSACVTMCLMWQSSGTLAAYSRGLHLWRLLLPRHRFFLQMHSTCFKKCRLCSWPVLFSIAACKSCSISSKECVICRSTMHNGRYLTCSSRSARGTGCPCAHVVHVRNSEKQGIVFIRFMDLEACCAESTGIAKYPSKSNACFVDPLPVAPVAPVAPEAPVVPASQQQSHVSNVRSLFLFLWIPSCTETSEAHADHNVLGPQRRFKNCDASWYEITCGPGRARGTGGTCMSYATRQIDTKWLPAGIAWSSHGCLAIISNQRVVLCASCGSHQALLPHTVGAFTCGACCSRGTGFSCK